MEYLLSQLLTESARRFSYLPAVVCGNNSFTYSQLDTLSGKIAATLRENGVQVGDRVGIYMTKSIESIAALFAVLKAGAAYVPIDWFAPLERIDFIVRDCDMKAMVTSAAGIKKIASEKTSRDAFINLCILVSPQSEITDSPAIARTLVNREEIEKQCPIAPVTQGIIDKDLAYILYTSGSTGTPKGVMLSHLNALSFVNMTVDFFSIVSQDCLVNHAPLHFDLSVFDIFCAIKAGGCAALLTEKEVTFPAAVAAAIRRHRITVWNSVPSALIQLILRTSLENSALSSLRLVLFAGELFPSKFLRVLMEKIPQAEVYNMYGQTEANSSTWFKVHEAPEPDDPPLPIGKAFPNYEVFALDDSGSLIAKPGTRGELFVRGATVGLGYWRNTEKTSAHFVPNPLRPDSTELVYKTGDIVALDGNGNFLFYGRTDSMVKCRGFRVDIGEIESALYTFSGVAEAAVIAVPNDEIGNRLFGFIIPEAKATVSPDEIKAFCSRKLPRYMVPEAFFIVLNFPRTSTGKIDRRKLLKEYLETVN